MTPHRIKRVTLALATRDPAVARAWSDRCSALFPARIAPLLDRLCSEADATPHPRRIDRLELDLGRLDPDDEDTLVQRLTDAVRAALPRALAEHPHDPLAPPLALLTLFARTGNLPWSADRTTDPVAAAFTTLLHTAPHALQSFLRSLADDLDAVARLARHSPPQALAVLLDRTFPDHAALLAPVRRALESTPHAPHEPPHPALSRDPEAPPPPASFANSTSISLALRRAVLTTLTRGDVGPTTFTPLLALLSPHPSSPQTTPTRRSSTAAIAPDTLAPRAPDILDPRTLDPRATDILDPRATDIPALRAPGIPDPRATDILDPRANDPLAPTHLAHSKSSQRVAPTDSREPRPTPAPNAPPPDALSHTTATSSRPREQSSSETDTPSHDKAEVAAGGMGRRRGGPRASRAGATANPRSPTRTSQSERAEVFAHLWRRARGMGRHRRSEGPVLPAATSAVPARGSGPPSLVEAPARDTRAKNAPSKQPATPPRTLAQRRQAQQLLAAEGELQLEDGGLVLLWPFISRLFERLELLEQRRFPTLAAQHQAIALLAHLTTGDPEPPEYQRTLAKLLCAHELADPCMHDGPIPDEHQAEAGHLLRAVIDHVPALQALDIAAFRAAFLARPAVLGTRDGTWTLQVERQPHDIVLERFPWSWMWIKLPWMSDPLRVEW